MLVLEVILGLKSNQCDIIAVFVHADVDEVEISIWSIMDLGSKTRVSSSKDSLCVTTKPESILALSR